MFYISRKVGNKYGVIDTEDGIEEFYYPKYIEQFLSDGIEIQGVSYILDKLVITPVIRIENKCVAAKNKMLTGTTTGHKGFDIKYKGDKITALQLQVDFKKYIVDNAKKGYFVLTIPEGVTDIGENFLKDFYINSKYSISIEMCLELPASVKVIWGNALAYWGIRTIKYNGVLDRIVRGNDRSIQIDKNSLRNNTLRVRILEKYSIFMFSFDLSLPDIEIIDNDAITVGNNSDNAKLVIGDKLKVLTNFVVPGDVVVNYSQFTSWGNIRKESISKQVMRRAVIIELSDNTSLSSIDMKCLTNTNEYIDGRESIQGYILVMSEKTANRLSNVFSKAVIDSKIALGLLTYQNEEGKHWLDDNLKYCCQHPKKFFNKCLDEYALGKCVRMSLK